MQRALLIAESDPELRDIFRSFLTDCGFQVDTASDGLDCLQKLRQLGPAVLVLDRELRWGGADGVLAWLREERMPSAVAVVLTATAGASPETAQDIESPVIRLLAKPFALRDLLASVRAGVAAKRHEELRKNLSRGEAQPEFFFG
jgi:DNA-binding response OmpR family regulator